MELLPTGPVTENIAASLWSQEITYIPVPWAGGENNVATAPAQGLGVDVVLILTGLVSLRWTLRPSAVNLGRGPGASARFRGPAKKKVGVIKKDQCTTPSQRPRRYKEKRICGSGLVSPHFQLLRWKVHLL